MLKRTAGRQAPLLPASACSRPRVGLALGSGSARGWAHIGVIQSLQRAGVPIDYVAGASIGALVGAVFCAGQLKVLTEEAHHLHWRKMMGLLDFAVPWTGLLAGEKLTAFIRDCVQDRLLEELPIPFWAVATNLRSGQEIWLRSGSTTEAVRASLSLPGIFTPVRWNSLWLVDGGLTNPVPVSVCRAMGADIVIAVNLNSDILLRPRRRTPKTTPGAPPQQSQRFRQTFRQYWEKQGERIRKLFPLSRRAEASPVSIFEVLLFSLNVMQDRITRQRLAADPPDLQITPYLRHIQLVEFYRAEEAIQEGERAAQVLLPTIREILHTHVFHADAENPSQPGEISPPLAQGSSQLPNDEAK